MEFRYVGDSGLKISEITYGNWLTHGSQVENDVATEIGTDGAQKCGFPSVSPAPATMPANRSAFSHAIRCAIAPPAEYP